MARGVITTTVSSHSCQENSGCSGICTPQKEVEVSKELSKIRIHMERAISMLKNKYTILKGTLPIDTLKHSGDTRVANIDKILAVCSALTNIS